MSWTAIIGHDRPKKILSETLSRSALAHAYLFFGEASIGKRSTALIFAQAVQCEGTDRREACGACRSCQAVLANSHPDVAFAEPDGAQIKIDQVRAIQDSLIFKPLTGRRKILIMNEADTMNLPAANCFLKTVEEPPDHSLLILISSKPHRLPSTILSRCQQIRFDPPNQGDVARFLTEKRGMAAVEAGLMASLCMGRIGQALTADLAELKSRRDRALAPVRGKTLSDIGTVLEQAASNGSDEAAWSETLEWIRIWLRDLLIIRASGNPALLINFDLAEDLSIASKRFSTDSILKVLSLLDAFHRSMNRNLNRTMVLETVLLELRRGLQGTVA
jgi:DNA polymerase III subunit delta'